MRLKPSDRFYHIIIAISALAMITLVILDYKADKHLTLVSEYRTNIIAEVIKQEEIIENSPIINSEFDNKEQTAKPKNRPPTDAVRKTTLTLYFKDKVKVFVIHSEKDKIVSKVQIDMFPTQPNK